MATNEFDLLNKVNLSITGVLLATGNDNFSEQKPVTPLPITDPSGLW